MASRVCGAEQNFIMQSSHALRASISRTTLTVALIVFVLAGFAACFPGDRWWLYAVSGLFAIIPMIVGPRWYHLVGALLACGVAWMIHQDIKAGKEYQNRQHELRLERALKNQTNNNDTTMIQYPDHRPAARLRLDAMDEGIVFRHGQGPESYDAGGVREASVVLHDGIYHLFYDGAEPGVGWLACLATSTDMKNWERHGPVFSYGEPGAPDSHTAASPWFIHEDGLWHAFYVGCQKTTPPPDCIPHAPYLTCKAEAENLRGPWKKRYDVVAVTAEPETYRGETASPGFLFRHDGQLRMFFSSAEGEVSDTVVKIKRTLGMASAPHPDGPWTVPDQPILPIEEQIENSSLYYEPSNQTWFLFTNHIGINDQGWEYTDAIWVYWSKDPLKWNPQDKAVVLDGKNCTWSKNCIGMPSVLPVDGRLAIFYDAAGGDSVSHMGRDIGLAWLPLPLTPPTP